MKKSKKLMILGLGAATAAVAATASVSGFAWFAINDSVAATGMKITADTDKYLEISKVTAATYTPAWTNRVVTGYTPAKSLKPTTLAASATEVKPTTTPATYSAFTAFTSGSSWNGHKWLSTASDSVDVSTKGTSKNYDDVTSVTDVVSTDDTNYANNKYALVEEFDIRVRYLGDKTSTYTLTATASWNNGVPTDEYKDKDKKAWYLHNSARIFFVVGALSTSGSTATAIADTDNGYILSSDSTTANASGDWATDGVKLSTALKADNGSGTGGDGLGNGIRVRAYIYFDGTDDDCFSSAVLGKDYSIDLKFTVAKN